jgi:hypothetical protein
MSLCPFCKAPVAQTTAPCVRCGRLASEHPSVAVAQGRTLDTDFFDEPVGELDLEKGSGVVGVAAPAYDGGGMTFDDDLFGDGETAGPLELDVPTEHPSSRRILAAPPSVPDLSVSPGPRSAPQVAHAPAARESGAIRVAEPLPLPPEPSARVADRAAPDMAARPAPSDPFLDAGHTRPASAPDPSSGTAPSGVGRSAAEIVARYPPPPTAVWEAPAYACRVLWRQIELRQDLTSLRRRRSPDVPLYEAALRAHDPKAFALGLALSCACVVVASFVFFLPVLLRFLRAED